MASSLQCDVHSSSSSSSSSFSSSSGIIGVQVFRSGSSAPHVDRINFDKKMIKRIKKQLQGMGGKTPDKVIVNLANGVVISDVAVAIEAFFKRDYPKIAKISVTDPQTGLTGFYFVPLEWLSSNPGLVDPSKGMDKLRDAMDNALLSQLQEIKRKQELIGFKGEGPEKLFYDQVKRYVEQTGHEVLVLHGAKMSDPGKGEQESDFIMVDRTLGAVIVTEVKSSLNQTHGTLQHAVNQVERTKKLLESWFGDLLKTFRFIGTVFGETKEPGIKICPSCDPFIIDGEADILPKLLNLKQELTNAGHTHATNAMDYRNLAKYLLFCVHDNKSGATVTSKMTEEVHQRVMQAGTPENIEYWSCWTPQQLGLMMSQSLRYVIFPSSMCTGKTECLVGKAIKKARVGEKVLLVVFGYNCSKKTLLYYKLKKRMRSHANIVLQYLNIFNLEKCMSELRNLIQQFPDHHIFVDELVLPQTQYLIQLAGEVEQLRLELEQDTGLQRLLWIAVAGGKGFKPQDFSEANLTTIFQHFFITKFTVPLRGTKNVSSQCANQQICNVASFKSNIDLELPSNLVQGIPPATFHYNSLSPTHTYMKEAMELVNTQEGTQGVALLVTSVDIEWVVKGVKAAGRPDPLVYTDCLTKHAQAGEAELEEWMEGWEDRRDLVADAQVSRGWEERTIVSVNLGGGGSWGPENLYLRTISRLIIVEK